MIPPLITEIEYERYLNNYYQYQRKVDMPVTIRAQELPYCCGVEVLGEARNVSDFYGTSARVTSSDFLAKKLLDTINPRNRGCYLYTTIASQKVEYNALKMAGFKIVGKFKNPGTGNWVFLWAWFKAPLPSRTRTVRGPRAISRVATPRRAAKRRTVRR